MPDYEQGEFIGTPREHLLAIFDEEGDAEAAIHDLLESRFAEDHLMFCVPPQRIDSTGEEHGLFERLQRGLNKMLSNADDLSAYDEAAREGACVLAVHAPDDESRDEAVAIVQRHNARDINYYGTLTVETFGTEVGNRTE